MDIWKKACICAHQLLINQAHAVRIMISQCHFMLLYIEWGERLGNHKHMTKAVQSILYSLLWSSKKILFDYMETMKCIGSVVSHQTFFKTIPKIHIAVRYFSDPFPIWNSIRIDLITISNILIFFFQGFEHSKNIWLFEMYHVFAIKIFCHRPLVCEAIFRITTYNFSLSQVGYNSISFLQKSFSSCSIAKKQIKVQYNNQFNLSNNFWCWFK